MQVTTATAELNPVQKFKLFAASPQVPTDVVYRALLDLEIESEDEIGEVVGCLERNRPEIAEKLTLLLKPSRHTV